MTRYALCIAAVEAAGTGLAALLPSGPDGYPTGLAAGRGLHRVRRFAAADHPQRPPGPGHTARPQITSTVVGYGVTRPAVGFASHRVGTRNTGRRRRLSVSPRLLAAGGAIMLLASGPTLLAVPLTTELHGRAWVAGAAVAFSLGCLLSTIAVEVDRQDAAARGAALVAVGPGHAGRLDLAAPLHACRGAVRAVPGRPEPDRVRGRHGRPGRRGGAAASASRRRWRTARRPGRWAVRSR